MPDLEIVFKTKAELQGAKATLEQTERQIGQAKILGQEYEKLEQQAVRMRTAIANATRPSGPGAGEIFRGLREGLGEVIPGFQKLDGLLTKFSGGTLAAIAGGFAVVASGLETLREGIKEFTHAQTAIVGLDAALAQTGQLAEPAREKFQKLAEEMEHLTAVPLEDWVQALTRLVQFGGNSANIDKLAEGVKNLAGIMGGDVQGAAVLLSKALAGSFEMLGRYGIHVDQAKTKLEQLNEVLEQVAQRGGGQLEARAQSLSGKTQQLSNSFHQLLRSIGQWAVGNEEAQGSLDRLGKVFKWVADQIAKPIEKLAGLHNAVTTSIPSLNDAAGATKALGGAQDDLAKSAANASAALDDQMRSIDLAFQHEVGLLEKRKNLELAKARLQERDPEKLARLETGINNAFGDAANLLSTKSAKDKLKRIDASALGTRREVEDIQDDLSNAEFRHGKVEAYSKRAAETGAAKVELEKGQEELEKRRKATELSQRDFFGKFPGRKLPDDAPESVAYRQQQAEVQTLQILYNDALAAENKAKTAVPGIGTLSVAQSAAEVKALNEKLNAAVEEAVPRLAKLGIQADEITSAQQTANTGRGIDRKTEVIHGKTEINKARDEKAKKHQEEEDKRNKERLELFHRTGIWDDSPDPSEPPPKSQLQQLHERLGDYWAKQRQIQSGRDRGQQLRQQGLNDHIDRDVRTAPMIDGGGSDAVRGMARDLVSENRNGTQIVAEALGEVLASIRDQNRAIEKIWTEIRNVNSRAATSRV